MNLAPALWRVRPSEHPRPPSVLSRDLEWDVLSLNLPVGLAALESMQRQKLPVGPVLGCVVHRLVHIPVTPSGRPFLERGMTVRPFNASCPSDGGWSIGCSGRMWLLPPWTEDDRLLTDFSAVFDEVHRVRGGVA